MEWLKNSTFIETRKVDLGEEEVAEVEVYYQRPVEAPVEQTDQFAIKDNIANLPQKFRKRADRMEKKAATTGGIGIGTAGPWPTMNSKSKAIDPTQFITPYDIIQVVPPPYDLLMLAKLYESNGSHNAAVTMKAINIVGLGYEWVENPAILLELEKLRTEKTMSDAKQVAQADKDNVDAHNKYLQQSAKTSNDAVDSSDVVPPPIFPETPDAVAQMTDGTEELMDELKVEKIELDEKLEELTDDQEFNEVMIKMWTDVESMGSGYLEIGRANNGDVNYIGHVPGWTVRVRAARDGFVQMVGNKYVFFRNFGEDTEDPLGDGQPNEMIQFTKYSPVSTYYGVPDIVAALSAAVGDKFAREYNLDYFENKAVPRYAFILKGAKLSQKAEKTLVDYFRNELKGKHHGTLYIPLPATLNSNVEAEFKQLEVGIQDSSFMNYIKENRKEILMVHRVPPGKVGLYENSNLAVSRDADKTFKEQVCRPEQRRVEKKINKIFKEFTEHFKLKFLEGDVIDADIRSRIHDRYARIQVITPNDIRRDLGMPARPGGNVPLPYTPTGTASSGPKVMGGGPDPGGAVAKTPGQTTSESAKKTAEGAKNPRGTPKDATGQRAQRGESQDAGRRPNDPAKVKS